MYLDIVSFACFLILSLFVFLVGDALLNRRKSKKRRHVEGAGTPYTSEEPGWFTRSMAGVIPQRDSEVKEIEKDLRRAGYYRNFALTEYLATRNLLLISVLILFGSLAVVADPGTSVPQILMGSGLVTAGLGYGLPRMVLRLQARRRVTEIEQGLPDALDMVTMCLTGGIPLRDALLRVSEEIRYSHPEIALEFDIIRRHGDANTMGQALRSFSQRVDAPDIKALAALVTQTERMGTQVSNAVAEFADSVRRTHRQRAEEQASKTSIKLLFPVILCLTPPIYILLAGPPILKLRNFVIEENRPGGVLDPASMAEGVFQDQD